MTQPTSSLGACAMCGAALIRNRKSAVSLPGIGAPVKAYYPEARLQLVAVWCPSCGLIHSLESPEPVFSWQNPEAEEARSRQAKPAP